LSTIGQERTLFGAVAETPEEWNAAMKTGIRRHTVTFGRWKTSISLEDAFWLGLQKIARRKRTTASKLVQQIARKKHMGNLSSAVRVFILNQRHVQSGRRL
jgi:predicted DNA-binding ribbon-helix-helix protein